MSLEVFSPLAAKLRPRRLSEVVGQNHALKNGSVLNSLAKPYADAPNINLSSVILWGPPGSGKTSIALAVAKSSGRNFIQINAVSAGVKEIREAMLAAKKELDLYGRPTILFIDEIHRFSRPQQDAVLAEVEHGIVLLIAATTENPTISINGPLLSRCNLIELRSLSIESLIDILQSAVVSPNGFNGEIEVDDAALSVIAKLASGDARQALVILESAVNYVRSRNSFQITETDVFDLGDKALMHYDKNSDLHFDVISAFIKSVRGSDADAAIHYLARMLESGEDPRFIARRLMILAAEDVGLADTHALVLATSAAQSVALIGMPEARIALAEAAIYLSLAPKSNSAYSAINAALADVREGKSGQVPSHLRNTHPIQLKTGKYVYPHDFENAVVSQEYLPDTLSRANYYSPGHIGQEESMGKRWDLLKRIIRGR